RHGRARQRGCRRLADERTECGAHRASAELPRVRHLCDLGLRRAFGLPRLDGIGPGRRALAACRLAGLAREWCRMSTAAKSLPKKPRGLRQSMSGLHIWTGLLVGWLLYSMFLTGTVAYFRRSEEHTSELQSRENLVCRLLL